MVIGSAVHALWVPRGLAIKYSDTLGGVAPDLIAALKDYWSLAYQMAEVPAYVAAILLLILVLWGKSRYPRWTVFANFGVLSFGRAIGRAEVPSPFGAVPRWRLHKSFHCTVLSRFGALHLEKYPQPNHTNAANGPIAISVQRVCHDTLPWHI